MRQYLAAALAAALIAAPAQSQRVVLPAGSVILVRTTVPLQSASAQVGQTFDTNVEESVGIDDQTVIPAGSKIRGRITMARPATRSQSGVIEVVFDRLVLPDGSPIPITGKLTSTDSAERRQINANGNIRVVLVGGRGGLGAAIAGATGSSSNSLLGALGSMLSEGRDVNVAAGSPLAVEIETAVTLRGRGRMRSGDMATIYTAPERIRSAQEALAQRGYYRGAATGRLDDATRNALFAFQVDNRLNATGNLDGRTAQSLGLNLAAAVTGVALSAADAATVRRDATSLVSRIRTALSASNLGQLDPTRAYAQGDLELWFALSAFADNAQLYEQVVRNGGNEAASVLASRALVAAMRRVDTAMQNTRSQPALQDAWASVKRRLAPLE